MSELKAEYKIPGRPSTIFRTIKNKDNPYVMIDRRPVDNPALSYKAKGILTYLLSRPDGWEVSVADLINHGTDGRASIRAGLKELRAAGHMHYSQSRHAGRITGWLIEVYEIPFEVASNGDDLSPEPEHALDEELAPECDFLLVENQQVENRAQVLSNCSSKETRNNISVDDYKKRIADATAQGILNSGKSHSKYGSTNWPPDVKEWGKAWMELKARESLTQSEFSRCIKEFRELQGRSIELEVFVQAYKAAIEVDGMTVKSPISCYYAADEIRQGKRKPDGSKPDPKSKPRVRPVSAEA